MQLNKQRSPSVARPLPTTMCSQQCLLQRTRKRPLSCRTAACRKVAGSCPQQQQRRKSQSQLWRHTGATIAAAALLKQAAAATCKHMGRCSLQSRLIHKHSQMHGSPHAQRSHSTTADHTVLIQGVVQGLHALQPCAFHCLSSTEESETLNQIC